MKLFSNLKDFKCNIFEKCRLSKNVIAYSKNISYCEAAIKFGKDKKFSRSLR